MPPHGLDPELRRELSACADKLKAASNLLEEIWPETRTRVLAATPPQNEQPAPWARARLVQASKTIVKN